MQAALGKVLIAYAGPSIAKTNAAVRLNQKKRFVHRFELHAVQHALQGQTVNALQQTLVIARRGSERKLSPCELRFATDAVHGSGSVDERSSNKVAKSVLELGSQGETRLVESGIRPGRKPKTRNTQVFRTIEIISEALAAKPQHKVQFLYYDIGFDLEKDHRYNGEARIETPILLTYENGRYYMISYSEEHDDIIARRLDRMERVIDTGQKAISNEKTRKFDPEDFERTQFNMFLGKAEWITLQINDKKMMNPLYDRFGERLRGRIEPPTKGKPATAQVKVIDSPQFRGWVEGMGGGLKIVEKKSQT